MMMTFNFNWYELRDRTTIIRLLDHLPVNLLYHQTGNLLKLENELKLFFLMKFLWKPSRLPVKK